MTKALVVIDAQESFRQRPNWQAVSNPDLVDKITRLVTSARAHGDLVVWVLHAEPGSGNVFDPALGHVRPMDGLAPAEGEPVLVKTAHNAFTTTNLHQRLTSAGIRELLVCGVRTEQCCETTARLAADLGFEVTFVLDATATTPIEHPDAPPGRSLAEVLADPRTLSTDDIVERTVYALSGRFAVVRTVADVVTSTPAVV
ncbi:MULTISPECIES: isochorismatase family protein [Actinoalloteichus]|uniref:Nicotinamidase-like amidase n=1 Tax=Actinoalloteichus fjordicus TaxID=1612552 RepID=A0AAC9LCK2_9PSEU|nr:MULTISPECIES: isochorismatase family protein [Actinoalloteichus]APU14439.1 nicotinamidase-like amidase [Actinoalloteichus fjordicus]APU20408.1 nicotinamidase-like amidase [Actinoalloteichus sp. GBA129-24]